MPPRVHDVVIVGGGPVGCAAAAALADTGLSIAVLEAQTAGNRAPDSRTLALSWNSKLILERLNAWPDTARPTPILAIHVSHRGRFGRARLSAADLQLPALGYVLRYSDAYDALLARTTSLGVEYRDGFKVNDIRPGLELNSSQKHLKSTGVVPNLEEESLISISPILFKGIPVKDR